MQANRETDVIPMDPIPPLAYEGIRFVLIATKQEVILSQSVLARNRPDIFISLPTATVPLS